MYVLETQVARAFIRGKSQELAAGPRVEEKVDSMPPFFLFTVPFCSLEGVGAGLGL